MLPTSPLNKRLWLGGAALAIFILTAAAANPFLPAEKAVTAHDMGLDFLAFYTGGTFVREGRSRELYDIDAVRQNEQALASKYGLTLKRVGPWWNPPFYALIFAPLSALPLMTAKGIWVGINALCLLAAVILLVRMLPRGCGWKRWGLVPLLIFVSMPTIQSLSHAQNAPMSLLIVALSVTCWRRAGDGDRRVAFLAGLIGGLMFYKPQLAAVLSAAMVITLGWPALLGLFTTAGGLLLVTGLSLPGTLTDFLRKLPANVHYMQVENPYVWERHVTLKGFWRLLFQGFSVGEATGLVTVLTLLSAGILAVALIAVVLRSRKLAGHSIDRTISTTIATTPLLMPFYFDYDLLLLAIPATLFAAELLAQESSTALDRAVLRIWIALYAALLVNPGLGSMTHINFAVPLLAALAGLLIVRAARYNASAVAAPISLAPIVNRAA